MAVGGHGLMTADTIHAINGMPVTGWVQIPSAHRDGHFKFATDFYVKLFAFFERHSLAGNIAP